MEAIFRDHFTALHRYISRQVKQPDIADDLTSMVFLKALRWLREDRGMHRVRSWLYMTARTTIAEYWQEQQKSPTLPLELLVDSATPAAWQQENRQAEARVQRLLQMLAERERQVLLLRYLQGYSPAEIGQQLGLSAGHVRVLQLRALRRAALLAAEERSLPMTSSPVTTCTQQGQRVLDLAKEEAHALHHQYIGVEHLLLGLLREGGATKSLVEQGATLELMRAELAALCGVGQLDPNADTPCCTPRSQQVLAHAGEEAEVHGETAISPSHILDALLREKAGIARGMLQSACVVVDLPNKAKMQSPEENERRLARIDEAIASGPGLSEEEERRLAHLVARSEAEKRRAELLKEPPNASLVQEGQDAYFQLIKACQHLVFSVAKEYMEPERDMKEVLDAGNFGLSLAATQFGMKRRTPFHTYAKHWIHLEIMDVLE
jgi:RNA polymerase sigma factor (sigma-70 family)